MTQSATAARDVLSIAIFTVLVLVVLLLDQVQYPRVSRHFSKSRSHGSDRRSS
jgi:hypothetical protein